MEDHPTGLLADLPHGGDEPHLLREVMRTYQAMISGFVRATGAPGSRFGLMRVLAGAEGGVGTAELARQLEVDPAAVTRQVQELEREGLVARRADARDGRRSLIEFTAAGRTEFERLHRRTHELERELAAEIGAEDLRHAAEVLARLRAFIERRR